MLYFNKTLESASARYNAEQMAKTVLSRIETNKTSQSSFENSDMKTIFSRDPNKRNSVFIGNLTWVSLIEMMRVIPATLFLGHFVLYTVDY